MPPKKRPSSSAGTAYESDNDAPRSKKVKKVKTAKKSKNDDDDDDDDEGRVRKKMGEVGKEGDVFWGVSGDCWLVGWLCINGLLISVDRYRISDG